MHGLRRRAVPPRPAGVPGQHDHERQGPPPRDLPRRRADHGHGDLQAVDLQARPARILQGQRQPRLQGQSGEEDGRHDREGHRGREERRAVRRRLLRGRRLLRAVAVLDAQLPRRRREPRPQLPARQPAELLLAVVRRSLVHGHAEQPRRLALQPQHRLPALGRLPGAQQRRIDRVRLPPAPLRQPLARLRPRARAGRTKSRTCCRTQRQRADLRHLRSDLHVVVDRAFVLVRLARQSVRHDPRRPRQRWA